MFLERAAIARMQAIVVVVVIIVAAGAGAYFLTRGSGSSNTNTNTNTNIGPIDLAIIESDPVNQVDSFNPMNVSLTHGTTVTFAVQNGDDEARTFQIAAFNVNQTIGSGDTSRITFVVGPPGVYPMFLPATPPFNGYKASPSVTGYVIVS